MNIHDICSRLILPVWGAASDESVRSSDGKDEKDEPGTQPEVSTKAATLEIGEKIQ
jgi:hypothetical protein